MNRLSAMVFTFLAVMSIPAIGVAGILDPIAARVAKVFPFEVDQQYQFKSAVDFHRPNGEVLPANTATAITISDTVINDTTWLRIPYWTPFGAEYYRLDDSLRVWTMLIEEERQAVLLDLRPGADRLLFYPTDPPVSIDPPIFVADTVFRFYFPEMQDFWILHEWRSFSGDSTLLYHIAHCCGGPGYGVHHGRSAPGGTQIPVRYGYYRSLFRPASQEPWPQLSDIVSISQDTPHRPERLTISAAPNPFNAQVGITVSAPSSGVYHVSVWDVRGALVRVIADEHLPDGTHAFVWDATGATGDAVGSGVYFMRVDRQESGVTASARVTLVR